MYVHLGLSAFMFVFVYFVCLVLMDVCVPVCVSVCVHVYVCVHVCVCVKADSPCRWSMENICSQLCEQKFTRLILCSSLSFHVGLWFSGHQMRL